MPRLPDRTQLGTIQPRGEQGIIRGNQPIEAQAAAGMGAALAGVGFAGMAQANEMRERKAAIDAQAAESKATVEMIRAENELAQGDDFENMEMKYRERVAKTQGEILNGVQDPERRELLQGRFAVDLERGAGRIQGIARAKETDYGRATLNNLINTNREMALSTKDEAVRSQLIGSTIDAVESARANNYLSDVEATGIRQKFTEDYAVGAADLLDDDSLVKTLKGDTSGTIYQYIPADKKAEMVRRAEDRMLVRQERREVKAERAIMEMDRHISSGVPMTPALREKWGAAVDGTSFSGDYSSRLSDEQEVQSVLRLPVDEQIRFVQEKQADIQSNGGDLREAANVERLTKSVQSNVRKLSEAPLLYAEERTGAQLQPVNIDQVMSDPVGFADQMTDRIATLNILKRKHGNLVQDRPLLPQEAQQLTSVISQATPQDQVEIFSALRSAIPDTQAYMGAMQQIAPDSPVRAAAGSLMMAGGEQVLDTNWFSPDQKVTAKQAATTMLAGEALMNKAKTETSTDGKPVSLPIPSAKVFADEFQSVVGDAFAGRPQAFDIAMQAARAHYVGTSAESGDFATDIDPSRLKQSVKSVLGEVMQYKDHKVLLPWGVDETRFRDEFRVNMAKTLAGKGLSSEQINSEIVKLPRLDVINFGSSEYMVLDSARRPYLVGGEPVIVRVGEQ